MRRKARFQLVSDQGQDIDFLETKYERNSSRKQGKTAGKIIRSQDNMEPRYCKNLMPKTEGQAQAMEMIDQNDITLLIGPAGSGKTKIAVHKAVKARKDGRVSRIILSRPAIEAGEKLGFLPGDIRCKMDPYMLPLYDALLECMSPAQLSIWIDEKVIDIAPLAFLQGRTLTNAAIILDEAQNATRLQLNMALTRLGFGSYMVLTGDPSQSVLAPGQSALQKVSEELVGIPKVGVCRLGQCDIVRHPTVKAIQAVLSN